MKYRFDSVLLHGTRIVIQKPVVCPNSGVVLDFKVTAAQSINEEYFGVILQCSSSECSRITFCAHRISRTLSHAEFLFMHPQEPLASLPIALRKLSPRFAELYRQAAETERAGNFDLAACGYRNAVEVLVKDYAIEYKGVAADEPLTRRSLQECIGKYLDGFDESVTAFAVKEFGNSVTHYPRADTHADFDKTKEFLETFIYFMNNRVTTRQATGTLPPKYRQE